MQICTLNTVILFFFFIDFCHTNTQVIDDLLLKQMDTGEMYREHQEKTGTIAHTFTKNRKISTNQIGTLVCKVNT